MRAFLFALAIVIGFGVGAWCISRVLPATAPAWIGLTLSILWLFLLIFGVTRLSSKSRRQVEEQRRLLGYGLLTATLMACSLTPLVVYRVNFPRWAAEAIFVTIAGAVFAAATLWERRYRRAWIQSRARGWQQVVGRFDDGDIVRMRKGRSKAIAGYQVWLMYEYECKGAQVGIYTLPFSTYEFSSEAEAEECRRIVANQCVPVRISPGNPKRSCVLDEDVKSLFAASAERTCCI